MSFAERARFALVADNTTPISIAPNIPQESLRKVQDQIFGQLELTGRGRQAIFSAYVSGELGRRSVAHYTNS